MYNELDLEVIPETTYAFRNRTRFMLTEIKQHQALLGRSINVLDIGCGTGDLITVWVARLGAEVVGIDIHEPSIRLARRRHSMPNLQFDLATAEDLLTEEKTYDVIICSEVLEHLHHPQSLLDIMRKLIRPDGLCLVTIPNGWGPKEHEESILSVYKKIKSLVKGQSVSGSTGSGEIPFHSGDDKMRDSLNHECGHVQFYTMGAIQKLAQQSGFRIEKQENRRFLSGPISDWLFGENHLLIDWNVRIAKSIPYWLASSWMFVFRPNGH
jgi:SAM-dependent methyltransferase